jgi:fructokinase
MCAALAVMTTSNLRLGIDLGGTKIAGAVLDPAGKFMARHTVASPQQDYNATLNAIADVIAQLELATLPGCSIGIGMPGSIAPQTGLVQNSNSTWLNGRPLDRDLKAALTRDVRLANDANCFALSEATDGAGAGVKSVFGVILGTGCGGGIVIDGRLVDGPRGITGEWGHNPLPWPTADELVIPACWCGRTGCLETWLSGPGLSADHNRVTGNAMRAEAIVAAATVGEGGAVASLARHADRLARGLASVVNVLDPDVIVLGGGLSGLPHLYEQLPGLIAEHVFADDRHVDVRPPKWGATSGVRGAAWLWG